MHLHKLQSLVILGMMRDLCRAFAVEQLTIQQLQTYGATYHLRSISIVGTVQAIKKHPTLPGLCGLNADGTWRTTV